MVGGGRFATLGQRHPRFQMTPSNRHPEPAGRGPVRWRSPAVGILLTVYFAWFARTTLWAHLPPDELMNIHYYWSLPRWQQVLGPLMVWSPLYRPMAAWFLLPVLAGFGLNPAAFRVEMLALLLATVFLMYRLSLLLRSGERAAFLTALIACYHVGINGIYYQTQMCIRDRSFLTFAATENVLSEADGLVGGIVGMNNFYLYQFQGTTFYQLIPWEEDLDFSSFTEDVMQGFTLPPNINVLAQRLVAIPVYLNFYLGQVSKAANLLGGTGGWADTEITNEYAVIDGAASDDPNKQCILNGALYSCGTAAFQSEVLYLHGFLAGRSPFVLPEVQADGFQPVASDPQISTVALAAPTDIQISMAAIAAPQGQTAPGALVNVHGANLGPAAQSSSNPLPRSLASTYVAVEGVRAPLATASTGLILSLIHI